MDNQSIKNHYAEDHNRLHALFHQFQILKSSDRVRAARHFREFQSGLEQHIAREEEILFPFFESKSGHLSGPTEVTRWEHREIRKCLDTIAAKLAQNNYNSQVEEMELQAVLCPHNHKEESILYPLIDQVINDDERAEMFSRMGPTA